MARRSSTSEGGILTSDFAPFCLHSFMKVGRYVGQPGLPFSALSALSALPAILSPSSAQSVKVDDNDD
jgi:hypothetical protein